VCNPRETFDHHAQGYPTRASSSRRAIVITKPLSSGVSEATESLVVSYFLIRYDDFLVTALEHFSASATIIVQAV